MRDKRGISKTLAAGIIVAIIVIAAIGVYYFLMRAPEPEEPVYPIETASSLQFTVDWTEVNYTFTYYLKDIDTDNVKMREESTVEGEDYVTIINVEQESVWMHMTGEWIDLSDEFEDQYAVYNETIHGYLDRLEEWTEGDVTYTDPETGAVEIHSILVDPVFEDALFEVES